MKICKGCWEQLHVPVPLRGVISAPFRAFGIRPSRMNPNTCTICELMFTKVMRARKITIDASIMFADLRGYATPVAVAIAGRRPRDCSTHSMTNAPTRSGNMTASSTRPSATPSWRSSIFRCGGRAHAGTPCSPRASFAKNWRARRSTLVEAHGLVAERTGDRYRHPSGELSFGEFGRSHRDLTAIGTVVNTASRAQSVAAADQILVTKAVFDRAQPDLKDSHSKAFQLKGFDRPIELYAA